VCHFTSRFARKQKIKPAPSPQLTGAQDKLVAIQAAVLTGVTDSLVLIEASDQLQSDAPDANRKNTSAQKASGKTCIVLTGF